jgi:hypothetical protein
VKCKTFLGKAHTDSEMNVLGNCFYFHRGEDESFYRFLKEGNRFSIPAARLGSDGRLLLVRRVIEPIPKNENEVVRFIDDL